MEKKRMTKPDVLAIQPNVRYCRYCELQSLLGKTRPYGYNAGVYG